MKQLTDITKALQQKNELPKTPFYLYSEKNLSELWKSFSEIIHQCKGSPLHMHFAMKSNNNPHILDFFLKNNAGLDIVSSGEIKLAMMRGFDPKNMVFSGVGKTNEELAHATSVKLGMINIESESELRRLSVIAKEMGTKANISFRVNPDVDAKTHPYISTGLYEHKFGVDMNQAKELYLKAKNDPHLNIVGTSIHIGSQMLELSALSQALQMTIDFCEDLKREGIDLKILDAGGGVGISYDSPLELPPFESYGNVLSVVSDKWLELQGEGSQIYSECGRALVAQAGQLITKVIALKKSPVKHFAIVDASMSELIRPALYRVSHPIEILKRQDRTEEKDEYVIVGPVCESADVFTKSSILKKLSENDYLTIKCVGAYGQVMSNHYNVRAMPAEWWLSEENELILSRMSRDLGH